MSFVGCQPNNFDVSYAFILCLNIIYAIKADLVSHNSIQSTYSIRFETSGQHETSVRNGFCAPHIPQLEVLEENR